MGAESFFIKFSPVDHSGSHKWPLNQFINKLTDLGLNCIPRNTNEYRLEEYFILTFKIYKDEIFEVSIEGCFSWFRDCILEIHKILSVINNNLFPIRIITDKIDGNEFPSQQDFYELFHELYLEKYDDFINRYGIYNVKSLPREDFYKYVKRHKNNNFLRWFFRR